MLELQVRNRGALPLLRAGTPCGSLQLDRWSLRPKAWLTIAPHWWYFSSPSRREMAAHHGAGAPAAIARSHDSWRPSFEVWLGHRVHELRSRRRQWELCEGGALVGWVQPAFRFSSSSVTAELPPAMPMELQAFVLWVVLATVTQQSSAVAGVIASS